MSVFASPSSTSGELLHQLQDSTATYLITINKLITVVHSIQEKLTKNNGNPITVYTLDEIQAQAEGKQQYSSIDELIAQGYELSNSQASSTSFNDGVIYDAPEIDPMNDICMLPYSRYVCF